MISKIAFLRFLRILGFRKLVNFFLTYLSYYLSKFTHRVILFHRPFTLSFEPTTKCNLACPECPSGLKKFTRNTGNTELENYTKALEKLKKDLLFLYLYFQGEPFIHKDFMKMIKRAKQYHIFTITSTNGHYLTPSKAEETVLSGLDRLLISIDGSTQEVYEQYRREGSLEKALGGIKNMVAAKQKLKKNHPELIIQMLVVRPNEHQIEEVKQLGKDLGVDNVVFKTAQIYDFENGHDLIPTINKYARYKYMPNGKWKIKNDLKNQCWKMWHSLVCTWDGDILPCCFDKDAKYKMGNIFTLDLKSIWESEKYNSFRKSILKSRKEIDICKNCSEGTKVWETI